MQQLLCVCFWLRTSPETCSPWDGGHQSHPPSPITPALPRRLQRRTGGRPGILALLKVSDDGMAQVLDSGTGICRGTGCQGVSPEESGPMG